MYPLDLTKPTKDILRASAGFAIANDEAEHKTLSAQGFEPKWVPTEADPTEDDGKGHTVESVRKLLDAAGITYDRRSGLAKLQGLLPTAPAA